MNAADIMTTRPLTAAPDTPVADLVRMMVERRVEAVPILDGDRLVGIVTQADIIRALASRSGAMAAVSEADRRIRDAFAAAMAHPPFSDGVADPTCIVDGGVVNLWGPVDSEVDRQALLALARSLPGVRSVNDHMSVLPHGDPFDRPNWPVPRPP
jgi:CBS domain-containing protein